MEACQKSSAKDKLQKVFKDALLKKCFRFLKASACSFFMSNEIIATNSLNNFSFGVKTYPFQERGSRCKLFYQTILKNTSINV